MFWPIEKVRLLSQNDTVRLSVSTFLTVRRYLHDWSSIVLKQSVRVGVEAQNFRHSTINRCGYQLSFTRNNPSDNHTKADRCIRRLQHHSFRFVRFVFQRLPSKVLITVFFYRRSLGLEINFVELTVYRKRLFFFYRNIHNLIAPFNSRCVSK